MLKYFCTTTYVRELAKVLSLIPNQNQTHPLHHLVSPSLGNNPNTARWDVHEIT